MINSNQYNIVVQAEKINFDEEEFLEAPAEFSHRCQQAKEEHTFHTLIFRELKRYIHPQGVGKKMLDKDTGQYIPKHIYSKKRLADYKTGVINHKQFFADQFARKYIDANQRGDVRYYASNSGRALLYFDIDPDGHEYHRKYGIPYTAEQLADAEKCKNWLQTQISKYIFESSDSRLYLKVQGPIDRQVLKDIARSLNAVNPYKALIEIKGTMRTADNAGCLARIPLFKDHAHLDRFSNLPEVTGGWLRGWLGTLQEQKPARPLAATPIPEQVGSCSFKIEVDKKADRYYNRPGFPTRVGELCINKNDNRIMVAILKYCDAHPNKKGTNPYKRHAALWSILYEQGVADHKYNHNRYKAIRDYYSSIGLINWVDCRHYPGPDGTGMACKWSFALSEDQEKEAISVKGAFLVPVLVTPWAYQHEPPLTCFEAFDHSILYEWDQELVA